MKIKEYERKHGVYEMMKQCKSCKNDKYIECETKVKIVKLYMLHIDKFIRTTFIKKNASYSKNEVKGLINEIFIKIFQKKCSVLTNYDEKKASLFTLIKNISENHIKDYIDYRERRIMEGLADEPVDYKQYQQILDKENILHIKDIEKSNKSNNSNESKIMKLILEDNSINDITNKLNISKSYAYKLKNRVIEKLKKKNNLVYAWP